MKIQELQGEVRILRMEREDLMSSLKASNSDLGLEELHQKYSEEIKHLTDQIAIVQDTNNKFIHVLDE